MLARYYATALCLSVCLSQVTILSKQPDEPRQRIRGGAFFHLADSVLQRNSLITALAAVTLPRTLDLENACNRKSIVLSTELVELVDNTCDGRRVVTRRTRL